MRIDLSQFTTSQIANESNAKKVNSQSLSSDDLAESGDRTTFSSDSSSVSSLVSKAMSSPEIRQELVGNLKQAVSTGTYKIDANAIAASMVDENA